MSDRFLAGCTALVLSLSVVSCDAGGSGPAPEVGAEAEAAPVARTGAEEAAAEAAPPREAPAFTLATLQGEAIRSADLAGKTVVLDFWATWCPPCEFQVPELNAFWENHQGDGDVVVFGVSVDVDTDDVVREWVEKKGVAYPILLGGEEVARRFGALGFPTLYVVAPDGRIAVEHVGLIEVADLETTLATLRAGG